MLDIAWDICYHALFDSEFPVSATHGGPADFWKTRGTWEVEDVEEAKSSIGIEALS